MSPTVRRFWPVFFLAILGALLLVLAYRLPSLARGTEPGTEVHALVHIDRHPPRLLEDSSEPFNAAEADEFCRTQAATIKSRLVLNAALRNPRLAGLGLLNEQRDPLAWLEKDLKVTFPDSREIMRISLEGPKPEDQRLLVDAIVDAYLEEVVNRERNQIQKRVDQLKELSKRYEDRVKSHRRTMRTLQEQMGADNNPALALRQQLALQEIKLLHGERLKAQAELRKLRLEREDLDDRTQTLAPEEEVEKVLKEDPEVIRLQQAAARLELDLAQIGRVSAKPEEEPMYVALQEKLKVAKKRLEKRREEVRPSVVAQVQVWQRGKEREARQQIDRRIRLLEKLSAQLSAEMTRATRESQDIVKGHPDLDEARQDISHMEEMARKLKKQAEKLTIELEAPPRAYRQQEAVISPR